MTSSYKGLGKMKLKIYESCFVAPSAVVVGDVSIGKDCGIWPNAVIRGDQNPIKIGDGSNIQDCCVIHTDRDYPVEIGKNVSIGHGAVIHGAIIDDDCLIGAHATVLNGARVRRGSIVGANALVTAGMDIPENSLVLGAPAKVVKRDKKLIKKIRFTGKIYRALAKKHKGGRFPVYSPIS